MLAVAATGRGCLMRFYPDSMTPSETSAPQSADSAFPWSDQFLLGYPPMDSMHREFVAVVAALLDGPLEQAASRLRAVAEHLESHFGEENRWMNEMDFPARDCHIDEHGAVQKSVREVLELVEQGDTSQVRPLAEALVNWFPGHADYLDSALSAWISKKRAGGKPVVLRRNVDTGRDA